MELVCGNVNILYFVSFILFLFSLCLSLFTSSPRLFVCPIWKGYMAIGICDYQQAGKVCCITYLCLIFNSRATKWTRKVLFSKYLHFCEVLCLFSNMFSIIISNTIIWEKSMNSMSRERRKNFTNPSKAWRTLKSLIFRHVSGISF